MGWSVVFADGEGIGLNASTLRVDLHDDLGFFGQELVDGIYIREQKQSSTLKSVDRLTLTFSRNLAGCNTIFETTKHFW